jgi:5-oxoprolinase (ATP-hydrolysing) subunit C
MPTLEIVAPGAYASIQDAGRQGHRRIGVPWAGVLDRRLMHLANALAGQEVGAPVVECIDGGLRVAARGGAVRVAVAGHAIVEQRGGGTWRAVAAWRSVTLAEDEELRLRGMASGRLAVLAVAGLALPGVLGSVSTYARAGLGGLDGRALGPGALLPAVPATPGPERVLPKPPTRLDTPIRVVPGPQDDFFTDESLAILTRESYRVTSAADRMGVRLEGVALRHRGAREIASDATVPGSIQVPGNGQPIVLLADAQTAGGYPKIGTVIGADLGRLADARPGESLRFAWVSAREGEALARAAHAHTLALLQAVRPLWPGGVDEAALYGANLVSGVVDARRPDPAQDAASTHR